MNDTIQYIKLGGNKHNEKDLILCRGCLSECNLKLMPSGLLKKFGEITNTPTDPNDEYPKYLCGYCMEFLGKFARFQKQCQYVSNTLHSLLLWNNLHKDKILEIQNPLKYSLNVTNIEVVEFPPKRQPKTFNLGFTEIIVNDICNSLSRIFRLPESVTSNADKINSLSDRPVIPTSNKEQTNYKSQDNTSTQKNQFSNPGNVPLSSPGVANINPIVTNPYPVSTIVNKPHMPILQIVPLTKLMPNTQNTTPFGLKTVSTPNVPVHNVPHVHVGNMLNVPNILRKPPKNIDYQIPTSLLATPTSNINYLVPNLVPITRQVPQNVQEPILNTSFNKPIPIAPKPVIVKQTVVTQDKTKNDLKEISETEVAVKDEELEEVPLDDPLNTASEDPLGSPKEGVTSEIKMEDIDDIIKEENLIHPVDDYDDEAALKISEQSIEQPTNSINLNSLETNTATTSKETENVKNDAVVLVASSSSSDSSSSSSSSSSSDSDSDDDVAEVDLTLDDEELAIVTAIASTDNNQKDGDNVISAKSNIDNIVTANVPTLIDKQGLPNTKGVNTNNSAKVNKMNVETLNNEKTAVKRKLNIQEKEVTGSNLNAAGNRTSPQINMSIDNASNSQAVCSNTVLSNKVIVVDTPREPSSTIAEDPLRITPAKSAEKAQRYDSDEESSEEDDLPDCLRGINENIYKKDVTRNFPDPKAKKRNTKFVQESEYHYKIDPVRTRNSQKEAGDVVKDILKEIKTTMSKNDSNAPKKRILGDLIALKRKREMIKKKRKEEIAKMRMNIKLRRKQEMAKKIQELKSKNKKGQVK